MNSTYIQDACPAEKRVQMQPEKLFAASMLNYQADPLLTCAARLLQEAQVHSHQEF